eukprot:754473-Hanusia_phi.AAC.1
MGVHDHSCKDRRHHPRHCRHGVADGDEDPRESSRDLQVVGAVSRIAQPREAQGAGHEEDGGGPRRGVTAQHEAAGRYHEGSHHERLPDHGPGEEAVCDHPVRQHPPEDGDDEHEEDQCHVGGELGEEGVEGPVEAGVHDKQRPCWHAHEDLPPGNGRRDVLHHLCGRQDPAELGRVHALVLGGSGSGQELEQQTPQEAEAGEEVEDGTPAREGDHIARVSSGVDKANHGRTFLGRGPVTYDGEDGGKGDALNRTHKGPADDEQREVPRGRRGKHGKDRGEENPRHEHGFPSVLAGEDPSDDLRRDVAIEERAQNDSLLCVGPRVLHVHAHADDLGRDTAGGVGRQHMRAGSCRGNADADAESIDYEETQVQEEGEDEPTGKVALGRVMQQLLLFPWVVCPPTILLLLLLLPFLRAPAPASDPCIVPQGCRPDMGRGEREGGGRRARRTAIPTRRHSSWRWLHPRYDRRGRMPVRRTAWAPGLRVRARPGVTRPDDGITDLRRCLFRRLFSVSRC